MTSQDRVPPQLKIRAATAADQDRLIPLINSAFAIETFLEGDRTNPERMAETMAKGTFLVAEDAAGRTAACVYAEVLGERGYAGLLAVDPAQQGQGIGRLMMQAAEDHLRRHGCVAVEIIVLSLGSLHHQAANALPLLRRIDGEQATYPRSPRISCILTRPCGHQRPRPLIRALAIASAIRSGLVRSPSRNVSYAKAELISGISRS